ncbi:alpha/beta hydrolase [Pelagicoccus sp. NFK12]|uniref:Alpha/beta hydrolase n=1 Tax=Pelagicoccus enzymogenes TaxID=2773457 RepID=A0A927IHV0_9BACT|nr:alpha/beta hydrolase [Pelagicoccus enzymogenes]MBD5780179.1 alpha/beta hydrolase [Pelagicoccus enzymogenes]MDQ8198558.1 alpha/beta hydrolase [Pelagicoccus enzymogenes]
MRERERKNGFNTLLVLVSVSVLFFFLFAQVVTKQLLFQPPPPSYGKDESILLVPAEDGTQLAVFWGPVPGASTTVFYFHGNGEDLGHVNFILNNYRLQGVNVLSFDYRGYGLSEGTASEQLCYRDAEAVLDYAEENLGVDPRQVVLHGRSLGGGIAMELAVTQGAKGLVLESAFLSAYQVYLPLTWVPGDKFVNSKKAERVECPTLVIHGKEDRVVSFVHGETLAAKLPPEFVKTFWVEGVGHNDLVDRASARYWASIRGFLAGL